VNSARVGSLGRGEAFEAMAEVAAARGSSVGRDGSGVGYVRSDFVRPTAIATLSADRHPHATLIIAVMLAAVALPALADPPPWAPAHGRRAERGRDAGGRAR
jgi:hypothetical protein